MDNNLLQKDKKKTALIVSGGGMSCGFSAGALFALAKEYNFIKPDIAIGGSGGAGNLAYFLTGQYTAIKEIWTKHLLDQNFINFKRIKKIMDIDYLVDVLLKKHNPLDIDKIINSSTKFLIPVTNIFTGKIKYFSDYSKYNIFNILKATKAVPVVYNKNVFINNNFYFDSPMSGSIALNTLKAIEMGAKKIIIIDNGSHKIVSMFYNLFVYTRSKNFRKEYRNYKTQKKKIYKNIYKLDNDIELLYFNPSKKMPVRFLKANNDTLSFIFDQGYQAIKNSVNLNSFLE